jgi:transposase
MKRTRRNHGEAFKAQAELAIQFGVHPTQITEWTPHLLARAVDVFSGTKSTSGAPDLTVLHAKIGQLALKNDFLAGALVKAGLLSATR